MIIAFLVPLGASAQAVKTTTVTVNATDAPDAQVWTNGSYQTTLVINPGTSTATSSPGPSGALDGSGNATFVLTSEDDITFPTKGKWEVTVCPQMGCVVGTMSLAFTQQIASTLGASVSLNLLPPSPRIPIHAGKPVNAYRDSEVISDILGSEYYNIPSISLRFCQALPCALSWTAIGTGGGGGGNSFSGLLPATNNVPGTFASVGNTWDFSGAAALKAPVIPSALPTASGSLAFDSTAGQWEFGQAGLTVEFGLASSPCASNTFVSTPATATSPATCTQPAFSGISGSVNLASQATGLLPHSNIASTTVTPGSYTNANITVAPDGSVTAAANGSGGGGSSAFSALTAGTNSNAGTFTPSGNAWDFSAATLFKVPVAAGTTPTTNGTIAFDSTANNPVVGVNGITAVLPTTSGGAVGRLTAYNSPNSITSVPLAIVVDAVAGAGIAASPTPWVTATTYPLCQSVSLSGANYLAVSTLNGATTPGTSKTIWYPVPNGSRPTQFDCAFYIAQSRVTGAAGGGINLQLGSGVYNSCIGMTYPTVGSPGLPGVNIHGAGVNTSIINQTCTLLSGSGGDGLAMLNVPPATSSFFLPRLQFSNFTLEGNAIVPAVFDLHACQQCVVEHLELRDGAPNTDHFMEIGTVGGNNTGWVYELTMEDVTTSYNAGLTGIGHGNGAAAATVTTSGGVPTITVTNGGANYDTRQLLIRLVKIGGVEACSTPGTNTATIASGVITAITSTATGCSATGTLFVQFYPQLSVQYSFKFSNMSDSHFISDLIPGGVGATAGVFISNISSMNTFYKLHPIGTFNGVSNAGNNDFFTLQMDSVYNHAFDEEGQNDVVNIYGTMFEWNAGHYTGSSDYYLGKISGSPTNAPAAFNIYGDICGNRATQDAYAHIVAGGAVDAGAALPNFVTISGATQYCNNIFTNTVQFDNVAQNVNWSNGLQTNFWTWGLGASGNTGMTLTNSTGNPWTLGFINSNAATSGANAASPRFFVQGNYWDGSVSQIYGPRLRATFAAGTGPLATFAFDVQGTEPAGGHKWTFDSTVQVGSAAAATTTAAGSLLYDSTNKNLHVGGNGVDNINAVVPSSVTITNNDCVKWSNVSSVITLADAGAACGAGGGGFSNPMTTLGDIITGGASGAAARLAGPTSPNTVAQVLTSTPSGSAATAPAWALPGISGRAVITTTSTDTIVAADCSPNRVEYIGSVSVAITLPTATTLAVPSCTFRAANHTTGSTTALTISPTTWTINGASTLTVAQGQIATIYVDPNSTTNWVADVTEGQLTAGTNVTFTRSATGVSIAASGSGGVSSLTGDGVIHNNSASTGAVTLTLANAAAGTVLANNGATGAAPSYTIAPVLGVAGTSVGTVGFHNATSGTITLSPQTGALGTVTLTMPAVTDTLVALAATQTLTNKSIAASEVNSGTLAAAQMPALTGDVTSSAGAVATTIAANAVTAAKSAVVMTRRVCDIVIGDTSGSALTNAQLGPQKRMCYIPEAATIVEVDVAADAGTPNVIVGRDTAGTIVNITSAALATAASGGIACSNTGGTTGIDGATTCSATLQNTTVAAGAYLELVSGTAGGTAKLMTAHVIYTVN